MIKMKLVSEMDLPYLPVSDPEFLADPFPALNAARARHPWLARIDLGYFVFGYQAVKDLAGRDDYVRPDFETVVQGFGAQGTPWADFQTNMLVAVSGERHLRIRSSTGDAFTPRNINRNIAMIRAQANAMLDEWVPKGKFDFVEFSATYPISVMCRLLGTSTDEIPRIKATLDAQSRIGSRDPALIPTLLEGYHIMWDYCDRLVRARAAKGVDGSDLLDQLIAAKTDGRLDEKELRYLLMMLFPAGYDTSKNSLSLILYYMIDRPDAWRRCADDLAYCHRVTEEMFRFHSTVSQKRTVVREFDYDGIRFPVGTFLIFGTSIVGRDPSAFQDADKFDPDLPRDNRNLAFGRGVHMCLGQHLARAQIAEGIHLIAQRITNPRRTGEVAWRQFLGIGGLETLPIEFDPAPARAS
jgi:cytochrome P450